MDSRHHSAQSTHNNISARGQAAGKDALPPAEDAARASFASRSPRRSTLGARLKTVAILLKIAIYAIFLLTSLAFAYILFKSWAGGPFAKPSEDAGALHPAALQRYAELFGKIALADCKQARYTGLDDHFNGFLQQILPVAAGRDTALALPAASKNVLLYGRPGTGKTFFACKLFFLLAVNLRALRFVAENRLATLRIDRHQPPSPFLRDVLFDCEGLAEMYHIKPKMFLNKYLGESEGLLQEFFRFLSVRQRDVPVIVFLDEADTLLGERRGVREGPDTVYNNTVSAWLAWLDGVQDRARERIFVVIATNFRSRLDSALVRRFGVHIGIPLPGAGVIRAYFEQHLFRCMQQGVLDERKHALVRAAHGLSLSKLSSIVQSIQGACRKTRMPAQYAAVEKRLQEEAAAAQREEKAAEKRAGRDRAEQDANSPQDLKNDLNYCTETDWDPAVLPVNKQGLDMCEDLPAGDEDPQARDELLGMALFNFLPTHRHIQQLREEKGAGSTPAGARVDCNVLDF